MTDLPVILQLSLWGTALALLLALLRRLLKDRLPHALFYYLWLLVLLRLVIPVAAPLPQPVLELPRQLEQAFAPEQPADGLPQPEPQPELPAAADTDAPAKSPTLSLTARLRPWLKPLWLAGAALHFLWFLLSYLRYTRPLYRDCVPLAGEEAALFDALRGELRVTACRSPLAQSPMLVGLLLPRVLLPEALREEPAALSLILRHELIHLSRRDLWYKWLTVAVTSFHWFNPLMPWLRREISRCGELSCDEALLRTVPEAERQAYGRTLLSLAAASPPAAVPATLLCEEKRQLKERLVSIVKHRKITLWMTLLSLLLALALAGCAAVLGPGKTGERFAAPLAEEHREAALAAIRLWGEENVPQHAQAELQFSESTGDGEMNTVCLPHLYDLHTGAIGPVDGVYPDDACLGVVYYIAPKTDDRSAEYHVFYLVQGEPVSADPAAVMEKALSRYGGAKPISAGWRQQNGVCVFLNTRFVTEDGRLLRYTYNGLTGSTQVKELEGDRHAGWDMTLKQLPGAMAAVAACHDQVERDYHLVWSGDFVEIALSLSGAERASFLARWSELRVLDLSDGTVALPGEEGIGAANYGMMSLLYPAQHTEYAYLVTADPS